MKASWCPPRCSVATMPTSPAGGESVRSPDGGAQARAGSSPPAPADWLDKADERYLAELAGTWDPASETPRRKRKPARPAKASDAS